MKNTTEGQNASELFFSHYNLLNKHDHEQMFSTQVAEKTIYFPLFAEQPFYTHKKQSRRPPTPGMARPLLS